MPSHGHVMVCQSHYGTYSPGDPDAHLEYRCGHCGAHTSGAVVAKAKDGTYYWLMCTSCAAGSVVDARTGQSWPSAKPGPTLEGLPPDVEEAYDEARRCLATQAYTATELVCRKILMHVAVGLAGSTDGQTFVSYIDDLAKAGYVTPPMRPWVDQIRQNANEATHELIPVSQSRAEGTLMFTAELLRLSYEMQHLAGRFAPSPPADSGT